MQTAKRIILFFSFFIIYETGIGQFNKSGNICIKVNDLMHTNINTDLTLGQLITGFQKSEFIISNSDTISNFKLKSSSIKSVTDFSGEGKSYQYKGTAIYKGCKILKILTINIYSEFPSWAFYKVKYINAGNKNLVVDKWVNHSYRVDSKNDLPDFWSFQGSSTIERKSWILPVKSGFYQKNYLGMNNSDYGGGIPVLDIWRKDAGIAIGHTDLKPKRVSLPVSMSNNILANIGIEYAFDTPQIMHPGDTINTLETFVAVHSCDYFNTLRQYNKYMQKKGIIMPDTEPQSLEPIWCAWGYERKFTIDEIIGTLPKVKELGFTWVTMDDGFQQSEGDWHTNTDRFPNGDSDMKKLVNAIHDFGLKAQLWWTPLAVDPDSKLLAQHPDIILKNADGSPQKISWWDSYYMSPAYQPVLDHTKETVKLFMKDWDFDGLKLDGQHLNDCPPDYNPLHKLANPNNAPECVPDFFKLIYETSREIKPSAVVMLCPCGDAMSFYNMPYTNQFVASDPLSSTQIRSKGKTYKALAPKTAYFGDHVEMSDNQDDFASTIGIGGVPGTKFTWPMDNPNVTSGHYVLTEEKEIVWKKWIQIYKNKMLSKGEYLGGLYDIGYDVPETHVIKKDDILYYAFYAETYSGDLTFRGLENKKYKVIDYVNNIELGVVSSTDNRLKTSFNKYLLLMLIPQ